MSADVSLLGRSLDRPSHAKLHVRVIGQMEIRAADGTNLLPAGRKTRALFGMLAILQPRALSRSRAAETLWSRRPSDQARASLRQELHRLLDGFGPLAAHVLSIGRDQMQLNPDTCWVDIIALQQASLENPQPLDLLDGVLLDGLTGIDPSLDSWIIAERERLNDWARTLADRILQAQGEPAGQIAAANRLLGIDRAHEGAWRSLMQAYAVSGDSAMALKAYERCRASLADLLGRTPSADTEQLCGVIRGDLAATSVPASSIYTADGDDETAGRRNGPAMPKLAAPRSHPADGHAGKKAGVSGLMFGATAVQADHPARPPVTFARSPANPLRLGIVRLDAAGATPMETRLALGLSNEIGSAMARFNRVAVVSLVHQPTPQPSHAVLHQQFGIDLLLEGTIMPLDDRRLRVELQLLDLRCGGTLAWSRRFEPASDDLLATQDEIAAVASAQVDLTVQSIEARRSMINLLATPAPYDLVMRASAMMVSLQRDSFNAAGDLLQRAVAADANFAPAWINLAAWHMTSFVQGWTDDEAETIGQAAHTSELAVMLAPGNAMALSMAGHVAGYLQHRSDGAMELLRQGLAANPNLPMAWAFSAFGNLFVGDIATAEAQLARYKTLAPMHMTAHRYDAAFIYAALLKGDFAGARLAGRTISAVNPHHALPLRPYLSALGHLGDADEIAVVRSRLEAMFPHCTITWFRRNNPFKRPGHTELVIDGLRKAGVAE